MSYFEGTDEIIQKMKVDAIKSAHFTFDYWLYSGNGMCLLKFMEFIEANANVSPSLHLYIEYFISHCAVPESKIPHITRLSVKSKFYDGMFSFMSDGSESNFLNFLVVQLFRKLTKLQYFSLDADKRSSGGVYDWIWEKLPASLESLSIINLAPSDKLLKSICEGVKALPNLTAFYTTHDLCISKNKEILYKIMEIDKIKYLSIKNVCSLQDDTHSYFTHRSVSSAAEAWFKSSYLLCHMAHQWHYSMLMSSSSKAFQVKPDSNIEVKFVGSSRGDGVEELKKFLAEKHLLSLTNNETIELVTQEYKRLIRQTVDDGEVYTSTFYS